MLFLSSAYALITIWCMHDLAGVNLSSIILWIAPWLSVAMFWCLLHAMAMPSMSAFITVAVIAR